jgi:hypothetical protein
MCILLSARSSGKERRRCSVQRRMWAMRLRVFSHSLARTFLPCAQKRVVLPGGVRRNTGSPLLCVIASNTVKASPYHSVPTLANPCQPLPTLANSCQPLSTLVNPCQPLSGKYCVFGGRGPAHLLGDFWCYFPLLGTWSETIAPAGQLTPTARLGHMMDTDPVSNNLYVSSGECGYGRCASYDNWVYSNTADGYRWSSWTSPWPPGVVARRFLLPGERYPRAPPPGAGGGAKGVPSAGQQETPGKHHRGPRGGPVGPPIAIRCVRVNPVVIRGAPSVAALTGRDIQVIGHRIGVHHVP